MFDVATGKKIREFTHNGIISALAISPDGKLLATSCRRLDMTVIRLFDMSTGKLIKAFDVDEQTVSSLAFSPSGKQLAAGSYNHKVILYDVEALKKP